MRRLPVYFLLDNSFIMHGELGKATKNGILSIISSLQQNPYAVETAFISIITIASNAKQELELTSVQEMIIPDFSVSVERNLGQALKLLNSCIKKEVVFSTKEKKGDWTPLVFILLAGNSTDNYLEELEVLKKTIKTNIVVLVASNKVDIQLISKVTEDIEFLDIADSSAISKYFWRSEYLEHQKNHHEITINQALMRRLPVYFLLDTSGSMYGEPIQALNNALSSMINTLRTDAQALDSVWLSMITFDREAREIVPLTELALFQLPEIICPQSGPTLTGKALEMLHQKVQVEIRRGSPTQKGDWKPLLFLFTDGKPNDLQLYREMLPKIKALHFSAIVCCAAGQLADDSLLKELTADVVHLDTTDSATLKQFFKWVSETIEQGNRSQGTGESIPLPPPPTEVIVVV